MSEQNKTSEEQNIYIEGEVLRPHAYDGIEEYDNPPPFWLQAVFYATVFFSLAYTPYYLLAYKLNIDTPQLALAQELDQAAQDKEAYLKAHPELMKEATEESLTALTQDAGALKKGKAQFMTTCMACHGALGEGGVGPNLTDNAWIHGGKLLEIRHTIAKGVPEKGMIAWDASLKPEMIDALVAYIHTLQGTNPPNAKAPQGTVLGMN